jgi:membrane associated rhomboid family serine protease
MFCALIRIAAAPSFQRKRYGKATLLAAGASGLLTTILGIALAFFPAKDITSIVSYELWMGGGTILFIGAAAFFFFVYGRRKHAAKAAV